MKSFKDKILILIVLVINTTLYSRAQDITVNLVVTTTNGTEQLFQLTEESQLLFEDGNRLIIRDIDGTTATFDLANIRKMVCTETTGTDESLTSDLQLLPNPFRDSFIIRNLQGQGSARIYTLDGRLVKTFMASEGQRVDISTLSQGMYLLHINGQTLKMMKL